MERIERPQRRERRGATRAGPSPGTGRYQVQVRATFVRLDRRSAARA